MVMKISIRTLLIGASLIGLAGVSIAPLFAIEKPDYERIKKDGDFEIRRYADMPVASTSMKSMEGDNRSFQRLFAYISGDNEKSKKIEMTSPVIMDEGESGKMRFVVPAAIAKDGTPEANSEQVEIETIPGGEFAVLKFAKGRTKAARDQAIIDLKQKIKDAGKEGAGETFFAFYDPPFKPSPLCTFEVWQRLSDDKEAKK